MSVFGVILVRIYPHLDYIRRDTVFSPNAGKCGPEYLRIRALFTQYEDFKDLTRRIASDKILLDKAFNIAKTP